jgi:hypothetical protein
MPHADHLKFEEKPFYFVIPNEAGNLSWNDTQEKGANECVVDERFAIVKVAPNQPPQANAFATSPLTPPHS